MLVRGGSRSIQIDMQEEVARIRQTHERIIVNTFKIGPFTASGSRWPPEEGEAGRPFEAAMVCPPSLRAGRMQAELKAKVMKPILSCLHM